MDDAFIMNTTFLSSLFPPLHDIGGEGPAHSRHHSDNGSMRQLETICPGCKLPLWECDFSSTYYRIFCDNDHCRLFRENQGSRAKAPRADTSPETDIRCLSN